MSKSLQLPSYNINNILISAYTGLGNWVMKTPMLKTLKQLYPHAAIDVIAGNSFGTEQLMYDNVLIRKTHELQENSSFIKKLSFFRMLRKEKYDLILLPFDANKNFLMWGSYIAGIKWRVRHYHFAKHGVRQSVDYLRKTLMYPNTLFVPMLPAYHEIDKNFDLLNAIYPSPFSRNYQTTISFAADVSFRETYDIGTHYFVLQSNSSNGVYSAKVWHPDNFIALIDKLLQLYPRHSIVLTGDEGDYKASGYIIAQHFKEQQRVINTMGKTSINEVLNIIKYADLCVCHDSGLMHFADALNIPLVALFGPTDYVRTCPLKPTSHVIFSKNEYLAATYNFANTEMALSQHNKNYKIMSGITVEEVLSVIQSHVN